LVLNPYFRCCIKDSINIYFYALMVQSWSSLNRYIKSKPNLLAITTSIQVGTKSILLRYLVCLEKILWSRKR